MAAIITLTTDFGTRDSYVAEMKAVILSLAPDVRLVDVTHEIAPQAIIEGALALEAITACSPPGTIHLAVVDPGVGTARRGLAVEAGGQRFVGPDNGLFTPIYDRGAFRAFELEAPEYRRPQVSRTFHGRDVFAPAAGHLALGVPLERFGAPVDDPVRIPWPRARHGPRGTMGAVVHVDRFGNLITSIGAEAVRAVLGQGQARITIGRRRLPIVRTYGDLPPGGVGALIGSRERLEIVVREGNAAARLGARAGTPVVVSQAGAPTRQRRSAPGSS